MLKRVLEAQWLQRLADRFGLRWWERFLLLRHDISTWDKARRIFSRRSDPFHYKDSAYERERFDRMEALLAGRSFSKCLEIGCAEGAFTRRLLPYCGKIVAMDISRRALERASREVASEKVEWVRANARHWRDENAFDLIVAGDFMYYLGDPRKGPAFSKALDEFNARLAAGLRPGGLLLMANGYGNETDRLRNVEYARRLTGLGLLRLASEESGRAAHDKQGMRCSIELLQKPAGPPACADRCD